jgi:hypothetical protein
MPFGRRGEAQHPRVDSERRARRDDVEMPRLDPHTLGRRANDQPRVRRKKLGKEALMVGIEMLHKQGCKAAVGRQDLQKLAKRGQAASRCTNGQDRWPCKRGT